MIIHNPGIYIYVYCVDTMYFFGLCTQIQMYIFIDYILIQFTTDVSIQHNAIFMWFHRFVSMFSFLFIFSPFVLSALLLPQSYSYRFSVYLSNQMHSNQIMLCDNRLLAQVTVYIVTIERCITNIFSVCLILWMKFHY